MIKLEEDPFIGRFFDTPEKKARWMVKVRLALIIWLIFLMIGVSFFLWSLLK